MKNVGSGAAAGNLPVSGAFAVCADEAAVRPPQGSALLLELVAEGVQIYACDAKDNGFVWKFRAPAADLFNRKGRQIGTHFDDPTWKINDGSGVVGESHEGALTPIRRRLYSPDGDQRRSGAENGLRRQAPLRAGALALLRDLPILWRTKQKLTGQIARCRHPWRCRR